MTLSDMRTAATVLGLLLLPYAVGVALAREAETWTPYLDEIEPMDEFLARRRVSTPAA